MDYRDTLSSLRTEDYSIEDTIMSLTLLNYLSLKFVKEHLGDHLLGELNNSLMVALDENQIWKEDIKRSLQINLHSLLMILNNEDKFPTQENFDSEFFQ